MQALRRDAHIPGSGTGGCTETDLGPAKRQECGDAAAQGAGGEAQVSLSTPQGGTEGGSTGKKPAGASNVPGLGRVADGGASGLLLGAGRGGGKGAEGRGCGRGRHSTAPTAPQICWRFRVMGGGGCGLHEGLCAGADFVLCMVSFDKERKARTTSYICTLSMLW